MATATEFHQALKQSLAILCNGDLTPLSFAQDKFDSEQILSLQSLQKLQKRMSQISQQNQNFANGIARLELSSLSSEDAIYQSYLDQYQSQTDLISILEKVAQGDYSVTVEKRHKDDQLSSALATIISNLRETVKQADTIARGDYSLEIKPSNDKDALGKALFLMTKSLREAGQVCNALADGDSTNKVKIKGDNDQLASAINQIVDTLADAAEQADTIARGDYSLDVKPRSDKDALGKALYLMTQSLREAGDVCNALAIGDTSKKVKVKGSEDQLATAINQIVDTLSSTAEQAFTVSKGDFSTEIKPRSDNDLLGRSLQQMTLGLRASELANKKENWVKTGVAELAEEIRGELNLEKICENVITYLAKYSQARIGVLYLADDACNLTLASSYAYRRRKGLSNKIAPGEGLVGQAVKEKQLICISDVPQDYIAVNSGLGEAIPNYIVVFPLMIDDSVKGAIELGSFGEFSDQCFELFDRVNNSIATAINSAYDRSKMQDLLEEAQRTAEELQSQQEELRATNEELEEQTDVIKRSEADLRTQQEQLQASNEELEEKTQYLERQKSEIEQNNKSIEKSKILLEEKARDLESSSKYKSEFLANMSHELRTPLNSLLILSKMLKDNKEGNLSDKQVESAGIIYNGGTDLLELINDILDLSKVEAGQMTLNIENIDINFIESDINSKFSALSTETNFEFSTEIDPKLPATLQTDRQRSLQVIKNLLSNAFKFTAEGSVIFKIFAPSSKVKFKQSHLNHNNSIGFSVTDSGIGIAPAKQRSIFEAFQQADGSTSRDYGGTGLGLTISRDLCALLGGEIQVQSEEGRGSCFAFYLPLTYDSHFSDHNSAVFNPTSINGSANHLLDRTKSKTSRPRQGNPSITLQNKDPAAFIDDDRAIIKADSKSVLIVEDDRVFSKLLCNIAKQKKYLCLAAGDGKSALHLAKKYNPSAILLDLGLPDIDGEKVLTLLKQDLTTRHIPVHVVSEREELGDLLNHGAVGYLNKPTSSDQLEGVFGVFDRYLSSNIKNILIVEDDQRYRASLTQLLEHKGVEISEAATGQAGIDMIISKDYDCVILDMGLPDMTGKDFLAKVTKLSNQLLPPIIVNTGKDLSEDEFKELNRYTSDIIIKGTNSSERLLDEVTLFLHQAEANLPESQRETLKLLHDDSVAFTGHTILMVDDDLRNTFALSSLLEEKGLEVIVAENGQKALDSLASHPEIDLVLMDIMMPVMDGYEAMEKIRNQIQYQDLPIIALTAKAMNEDKARCLEAGANDYMNKPVDTEKLLSLIKMSMH